MVDFVSLFTGMSERDIGFLLKSIVQDSINSQLTNAEISEIDEKTPVLITNSKDVELMNDISIQAAINREPSTVYLMPEEPDGIDLKLWVKFHNAGELRDYSYQKNKTYSTGANTMPGLFSKFNDDSMMKYELYSYFNGNSHYAHTLDNALIQILPNITNSKITSFFMRVLPVSLSKLLYAENNALFTKVDDDQLRYGYSVTVDAVGNLNFYVRNDYRQYHLPVKNAYNYILTDPLYDNGSNFRFENFNKKNFLTGFEFLCGLVDAELPFHDWFFKYNPTTHNMSVINTTENNPAFVYNDTSFILEQPYLSCPIQEGKYTHEGTVQTTVYDNSGNNNNGTINNLTVGGEWQDDNTLQNNGGNTAGDGGAIDISFPSIPAINTQTEFTVAFWFNPLSTPINPNNYNEFMVYKDGDMQGDFWIERKPNSGTIDFTIRDSADVFRFARFDNAIVSEDTWYFIVCKWKSGENLKISINNSAFVESASTCSLSAPNNTGILKIFYQNRSPKSKIALFKFYNIQISQQTQDDLYYQGYHNPLFPKSENIQPVQEEDPDPVFVPFTNAYTLDKMTTPVSGDYRRINSLSGDNPFIERYNVADGTNVSDPETIRYNVPDGVSGGSDPFVLQYDHTPSGGGGGSLTTVYNLAFTNSWGDIEDSQNQFAMGQQVKSTSSNLYNKVITEITIGLKRGSSTPSGGTIYPGIIKANGNYITFGSGISPGSLTSSEQQFTGSNSSNNYALQIDDAVGMIWVGSGSGVVDVQRGGLDNHNGDGNSNSRSHQAYWDNNGWHDNPDYSISGIFKTGGTSPSVNLSTDTSYRVAAIEILSGSGVIGKVITKAHFFLLGSNTPSGTVYCRVWDNNNNLIATLGTRTADSLSTSSFTEYTFGDGTASYNPIQANWKIGIEYPGGGSSNDTVHVQISTSSSISTARRIRRNSSGTWSANDSEEVGGKLYSGTGQTSIDPYIHMNTTTDLILVGNHVGSNDTELINKAPTKITLRLKRTGTISGNATVGIFSSTGTLRKAFTTTLNVGSISTAISSHTFQDLSNDVSIQSGNIIGIYWNPSGTGSLDVLTNSGLENNSTNNHNSTSSYVRTWEPEEFHYVWGVKVVDDEERWTSYNGNDISGAIYTGGNDFNAFRRFGSTRTRVTVKAVNSSSSLHNRKITKVVARIRKFGTPSGIINCYIRDSNDNIKVTYSSVDVNTVGTAYGDVEFTNVVHNYLMNSGTGSADKISIEYSAADVNNYIELNVNQDVVDTLNTIVQVYDNGNYVDHAQVDLAGKMYEGGEPDLNSRTRVVQSIEHQNSRLKGKKLTRIKAFLYRTTTNTSGTVYCNIRRGTDDSLVKTIQTFSVSNLSTSITNPTQVTFEDTTNNYPLTVGDKVSIEFNGGNTTDQVGVLVREVVPNYDGTDSFIRKYDEVDYDDQETTMDLCAVMDEGGFFFTPDPNEIPDPTPTNIKDLLYGAGNNAKSGFMEMFLMEFRIYSKDITLQQADYLYQNRYSISPISPGSISMPFSFKASSLT